MAGQLILRGGGDGGGIVITPDGHIRPVPPFEPGLRFRLAALGELLRAAEHGAAGTREKTAKLAQELSTHIVHEAQAHVAELGHGGGVIRLAGEDIDICGTPPRHINLGEFIPPRGGPPPGPGPGPGPIDARIGAPEQP